MPLAPPGQAVEPEVTIVTDAVDFCLLAVRWLRPGRLDAATQAAEPVPR